MTKRVLVTGATGFIGRPALSRLLAKGYEVHAVTRGPVVASISDDVRWHCTNLLDDVQTAALMAAVRPTHLLHLAWYAVPGQYWTSVENVRWVQASLALVEEFVKWGGQRVTVAGTCAEYDRRYGYCSENLSPLAPSQLYSICKHSLHLMLASWSQQMDFSLGWARIFFLYGPNEHPQRLVASVVSSLLKGQPAMCTAGTQIRDFLHVHDVADALVTLLDSDIAGPVNIASGMPVAVRDIVLMIGQILDRKDLVRLGALPFRTGEPPLLVADVSRLTGEVGWTPQYTLDAGLRQTIEWWQKQIGEAADSVG